MKKFLIITLITLITLTCLIAKPFEINIGAAGTYNKGYKDLLSSEKIEIGDFSIGADLDVKLLFLDIDATALYSKVDENSILNGIVSANFSLDLFFIRAQIGAGYDYAVNLTTKEWQIAGQSTFDKSILEQPFYLRGAAYFLLGNLRVGVFATYPTGVSIPEFVQNIKEVKWDQVLQSATYGAAIKVQLI